MATAPKLVAAPHRGHPGVETLGARLDPSLRAFIDRVIVPALVREYIAEHEKQNRIANRAGAVRQFQSNEALSAEEIQ